MNEVKSCLIVGDQTDDQEIFLICVKKVDKYIDCKTSNNRVEAIDILLSNKQYVPEYIFLDVNMPLMSGTEWFAGTEKN